MSLDFWNNRHLKHAGRLVADSLVKDVEVSTKRQGYNVVSFCPGVAHLLVLQTFAQGPSSNCLARLYIP